MKDTFAILSKAKDLTLAHRSFIFLRMIVKSLSQNKVTG